MPEARDSVSGKELGAALRGLRRQRYLYSPEQVTFIRESYLLDRMKLGWIQERLDPPCSRNAIYKIAVGEAYMSVPLSPRLVEAFEAKKQRGPEAESGAADPVRADELLGETDWG